MCRRRRTEPNLAALSAADAKASLRPSPRTYTLLVIVTPLPNSSPPHHCIPPSERPTHICPSSKAPSPHPPDHSSPLYPPHSSSIPPHTHLVGRHLDPSVDDLPQVRHVEVGDAQVSHTALGDGIREVQHCVGVAGLRVVPP